MSFAMSQRLEQIKARLDKFNNALERVNQKHTLEQREEYHRAIGEMNPIQSYNDLRALLAIAEAASNIGLLVKNRETGTGAWVFACTALVETLDALDNEGE